MAIADLVYEQTRKLPEHLSRAVLDFAGYLLQAPARPFLLTHRDKPPPSKNSPAGP